MRILLCCIAAMALFPVAAMDADPLDSASWDRLLKTYVDDQGRVDYERLRKTDADRKQLDALYAQVSTATPDGMSRTAQETFFLNAYNVIVWKNVIDTSPKRVDASLYAFFHRDFTVAAKTMSLDDLEKKLIRATFKDPRVHFALNCASAGCPRLPPEAFTPQKLDEQLDREAKKFCNDKRNVDYDAARNGVTLSMIFKWYAEDFGGDPIGYCNARRPSSAQVPRDAKIQYREYDWRLNDRSLIR